MHDRLLRAAQQRGRRLSSLGLRSACRCKGKGALLNMQIVTQLPWLTKCAWMSHYGQKRVIT